MSQRLWRADSSKTAWQTPFTYDAEGEPDEGIAKKSGDLITSDSAFVLRKEHMARGIDSIAHAIRDRGSGWTMARPSASKGAAGCQTIAF